MRLIKSCFSLTVCKGICLSFGIVKKRSFVDLVKINTLELCKLSCFVSSSLVIKAQAIVVSHALSKVSLK